MNPGGINCYDFRMPAPVCTARLADTTLWVRASTVVSTQSPAVALRHRPLYTKYLASGLRVFPAHGNYVSVHTTGGATYALHLYCSLWSLRSIVYIYLVDVQSLSTSILSIILWISNNATCGTITSLFLLVVRSVVCSTYLYRDVDINAGQLACYHKYQGMLP